MNTTWTEFLVSEGATLEDSGIRFDAPEADVRAVESNTVAVPLVHLGLIRCAGDDSVGFLHNLLSNDVKKLGPQSAQWSSFNTPKGRMLASLLLWQDDSGQMIATSADIQPMLQKKLSMYVLRSKVKLADATPDTVLIGVSGVTADATLASAGITAPVGPMTQSVTGDLRCIRLDQRNLVVAVPAAVAPEVFAKLTAGGATKAGTAAWQLAMIRAGLPLITAATQEEFVAQMLNFEVIGGVSFNKGCYPGQEIVARTQYLGKLKKRMYRVHVPGDSAPAAGADLFTPEFGEQSAGKLVNVVPAPQGGFEALAVMQISCAEAGEVHLGSSQGPLLQFLDLPYALPEK
ncbi:YgfZ/GcvT domain-containing protein [Aromatoleum petrolei]|uniref:Folate-binding protein n=1 Tax=Aromatoleum petrolei TaxID=76116 RepID=A0ABX1MPI8_9RHOO|nr:folate-binding protein YgfZ [Aromatoleum petrolei]NMF88226.1 folate-binding protein [Aromatoleum petrolei]QTQ38073.1 Putative aminomethyltransferase [Aromatoleum petrolei]